MRRSFLVSVPTCVVADGSRWVAFQAPDGWDKDILQDYMSRIVGQICFIMDPEETRGYNWIVGAVVLS